jgi:hypothetical protein
MALDHGSNAKSIGYLAETALAEVPPKVTHEVTLATNGG